MQTKPKTQFAAADDYVDKVEQVLGSDGVVENFIDDANISETIHHDEMICEGATS